MSNTAEYIVWADCEMTGLDVSIDELVEVAVIITDSDLAPVHEGLSLVINPSKAALDNMGEFVTEMHTASGLITEIPDGISLADAQTKILAYINEHVPNNQRPPLAGNSIGTDRLFLSKYMPEVDARLHYRMIDVSSIKELSRRWYPRVYFNTPEKNGGHRALADIRESIRELDYYRQALFVAEPGPSSDEASAISQNIVNSYNELP